MATLHAPTFTIDAIPLFELGEKVPRRPHPTFLHVSQALADALNRIVLSRDIEERLIGVSGPGFI